MPTDSIPEWLAASFARSTGLEREDLAQEARLAAWRAEQRYDPELAAWSTFSHSAVTRQLCTVLNRHRRYHSGHVELADEQASQEASQEDRLVFLDMLRQLPEDARTVAELALSSGDELLGLAPNSWSAGSLRDAIRTALGWPASRVNAAVNDVVRLLLRGEMMVRRT